LDDLTRRISQFASSLTFEAIPETVVTHARQSLVDTIGCAFGAADCDAAQIGRRLAEGSVPTLYPGRILLTKERSTAEAASFTNSAMIRYLDFNDQRYGGHPSDMLGGLLAIAEAAGADGRGLLTGMIAGYETALRMTDATKFRQRGWDQGFSIAIATAVGASIMLGLSADKIAHAVAIAAVGSVPLRATRAGNLSLWKGAATAYSCRNGIFAALVAAEGMTGPEKPFEGRHGLWEQITGPFEYEAFATEGGVWRMPGIRLKYWPVEYNAQIAVWASLELRKIMPVDDIANISIGTYWSAWHEIGSEPAKWDPQSRETADHSMPYCFARALVDGEITLASFDEAAYLDPSLRPLMQKIEIHEDDAINAKFPAGVGIHIEVTRTDGSKHVLEMENPRGHELNPMTHAETDAKFLALARPMIGVASADAALKLWWAISDAKSLTPALDAIVIDSSNETAAAAE
jgi:2-methylcitrate dehydratase